MKRGLLVGINYTGTKYQLNGCVNDTENLRRFLVEQQLYRQEQLTVMTDQLPSTSALYPSKGNMITQMKQLVVFANQQKEPVQLFFSYSGHGSQIKDTSGDEDDGLDEVLCPVDGGSLVDDEIRRLLIEPLGSHVTLVVLIDACHSGTVMDLKYTYLCDEKHRYVTQGKVSDSRCQVVMISGCRDDQTSVDAYVSGTYQGAMTASFLANYQSRISCHDLMTRMRGWLKEGKYRQKPQLSSGRLIDVKIPLFCLQPQKSVQIVSAHYGKGKVQLDVTQKVKGSAIPIRVNNQLFTDPCRGVVKELRIRLSDGSQRIIPEGGTYFG